MYRTRWFSRWARRQAVTDQQLIRAVREIQDGLTDAWLGGNLVKKRVPASGRGKRSGFRLLLAWRPGHRAVFIYGFAKNERDNVSETELQALRLLAAELLALDSDELQSAISAGELIRLAGNGK